MLDPTRLADNGDNRGSDRIANVVFAAIIGVYLCWIFSLPLVPTQDGPMHRYYIHVLDAVLHGSKAYGAYRIRHPFPPYATHYAVVGSLSHVMSYDTAEKIFVVLIVGTFAYGLRFCAESISPMGSYTTLFCGPLLLHWALMMGFFNYSFAVAIFLWIAGCWQRATRGVVIYWLPFALLMCLLTVTHPVPLLILIVLCCFDLMMRGFLLRSRSRAFSKAQSIQAFIAILFCLAAFKIPESILQKNAASSAFSGISFHARLFAQTVLLSGISPYYTRATRLLPNLERVLLYLMLLVTVWLAGKTFRAHWRERMMVFGDSFFLCTVLLALSIPIIPDVVNGSGYFSTRLMLFVWVGAMVSASGALRRIPVQRAVFFTCVGLVNLIPLIGAQFYFRPAALALESVEKQALPAHAQGLVLSGNDLDDFVHHHLQIEFDPYVWGPALSFVRANAVILDSPWVDQNITPLEVVPGSAVMPKDIRLTQYSEEDPAFQPGGTIPRVEESNLVKASTVVMDADTPPALKLGIGTQLPPADAALFHCQTNRWYLLCLR